MIFKMSLNLKCGHVISHTYSNIEMKPSSSSIHPSPFSLTLSAIPGELRRQMELCDTCLVLTVPELLASIQQATAGLKLVRMLEEVVRK